MFKKMVGMFTILMLMFVMLAMFAPASHSAAKQIDLYRYLYPQNALYDTVTVTWEEPLAADPNLIWDNVQVTTQSLVAGVTQLLTVDFASQADCARTVSVTLSSAIATATAITGSELTISGIDSNGIKRTEVIVASQTVAYSNYAYLLVSTITYGATTIAGAGSSQSDYVSIDVGIGAKLGLTVNINATTDVFGVIEDDLVTDPADKADEDYDTIDFASDPDGTRDYKVHMRAPVYKRDVASE